MLQSLRLLVRRPKVSNCLIDGEVYSQNEKKKIDGTPFLKHDDVFRKKNFDNYRFGNNFSPSKLFFTNLSVKVFIKSAVNPENRLKEKKSSSLITNSIKFFQLTNFITYN